MDMKLVSRENHPENTIIKIDNKEVVGGKDLMIIAGPCSVESEEQILEIARELKECGVNFLRGGAYKPRTSPYAFQGLKEEGLKLLQEAKEETGMKIVSEITSTDDIDLFNKYVDIIQIGSRNMQNFDLLTKVGKLDKPILLKRGLSATIEEWLMAAEYIMSAGNKNVILCERGIRTYETATRNTLDISAIPIVKELTHLPIIVDPSHAAGKRELIEPLSKAAIAAGSDGLIIEVHNNPDIALSDNDQQLTPKTYKKVHNNLRRIASAVDRNM